LNEIYQQYFVYQQAFFTRIHRSNSIMNLSSPFSPKLTSILSAVILTIAAAVQLLLAATGPMPVIATQSWRVRNQSATWRSADLMFGHDYAEYIEFVKATVPEDGLVIIPKESQDWTFGNVGLMQYFLFPRQIANCPITDLEGCILKLTGTNIYLLAINASFPPKDLAAQVKLYIEFDGERGIFVPYP
jgi:hypothetical protein